MRKVFYPTRAIIFVVVLIVAILGCSSSPATKEPPKPEPPREEPTEEIVEPPQQEDTPVVPPTVVPASPIVPPAVTPSEIAPTPIVPPTTVPTAPVESSSNGDSCPGAPRQRLNVGSYAYVCTKSDPVRLRVGAGSNYNSKTSLKTGTEVYVADGPVCANNWSWWWVETESGESGWMAEGGDNIDPYFLCPR
jgi:uncharacterized protein YgiM (DUF1202 family)